jgi:hypothetical protein
MKYHIDAFSLKTRRHVALYGNNKQDLLAVAEAMLGSGAFQDVKIAICSTGEVVESLQV